MQTNNKSEKMYKKKLYCEYSTIQETIDPNSLSFRKVYNSLQ
jgi:hypothetical protein